MSESCPNGCHLETFRTHQGPPDCDLEPSDPDATITTAVVWADGRYQRMDVVLPGWTR